MRMRTQATQKNTSPPFVRECVCDSTSLVLGLRSQNAARPPACDPEHVVKRR